MSLWVGLPSQSLDWQGTIERTVYLMQNMQNFQIPSIIGLEWEAERYWLPA